MSAVIADQSSRSQRQGAGTARGGPWYRRPVDGLGLVALLLLVALAAGCGGGDSEAGDLPSCAEQTRSVDPPADLPDELPLPDGLVLTDAQHPGGKEFRLRGVVGGDLDGIAGFFKEQLPENGFELKESEAEEHEQEGEFEGHDYEGSWRVVKNPDPDCEAVAVFVTLGEER